MSKQAQHLYEFGQFRLDARERLLLRDGVPVPLQPKAFDTLLVLVENGGRLVEKDELMRTIWRDSFVEEVNLSANISLLRKALGEKQNGHKYIETVPKHGYRFVAPVREVSEAKEEAAAPHAEERTDPPKIIVDEETATAAPDAPATAPDLKPAERAAHAEVRRESKKTSRPLLAGLLLLFGLTAAPFYYFKTNEPDTISAGAPVAGSLAVLPFRSLNREAEDHYLSVGVADTLITKLGNLRQLTVRPTSAVLRYGGGSEQDAMAAGRALRTEAVLEGSIHRFDDRVRITVRLVSVRDGATVWAETFDEPLNDLLAVQDSISERVAHALMLNLSREDRLQLTKRHTENAEAYRLYLMGRYIWNRRGSDVVRSREYFQRAIALDPNFALAHVGLADSYSLSQPPPAAERAVRRALELDDSLGEAHATLGFILMFQHWDWTGAEREFRRAIELNPNYATAHHWYGVYFSLRGRLDDAKSAMRRALEIDPTSLIINADLGQLHYFAREYTEAEAQCRRVLEMDANFPMAHKYLYDIYIAKGMPREALESWTETHQFQENSVERTYLRGIFTASGLRGVWQHYLNEHVREAHPRAMGLAILHTLLGDREQAIHWLNRAHEEHDFMLPFISVDPMYDDLRSDARFTYLLRRMNLAS